MTATLVNIRKLLAEVRQSLLEAQKAFNEQTKLLDKKDAELHASLNMLAVAALDERAALTIRAEQAEASAAAMREALEHARCALAHITPSGHDGDEDSGQCDEDCALCDVQSASDHLDAAHATDAGKEMLERVRKAEAGPSCPSCGAATRPDIHICHSCLDAWVGGKGCEWLDRALAPYKERAANHAARLLRAAQSLHRAWRRDRVSRGCKHGFRSDCRLGCTDYSCELVRADGRSLAAVEADRDAATQQRDEAREALDLAWGLIANANGGDWTLATPEWRAAAERWRDEHYSKRDTDAGSQMLERVPGGCTNPGGEAVSTTDLLDRIAALEALILDYRADHDDRLHENTDGNDVGCVCPLCDRADELEVEP